MRLSIIRRFLLSVPALGLLAALMSCAPVPRGPADRRFEAAWQSARSWQDLAGALSRAYPGRNEGTEQLLLQAMLWPEKLDTHPRLLPHPAWAALWNQGRRAEVETAMRRWRSDELCAGTWSLELTPSPAGDGALELRAPGTGQMFLPLPPDAAGWVTLAPDRKSLSLRPGLAPQGPGKARLVLALNPDPRPAEVYRHGDEITVAAWGVAWRLVALQWRQDGKVNRLHWFADPQ